MWLKKCQTKWNVSIVDQSPDRTIFPEHWKGQTVRYYAQQDSRFWDVLLVEQVKMGQFCCVFSPALSALSLHLPVKFFTAPLLLMESPTVYSLIGYKLKQISWRHTLNNRGNAPVWINRIPAVSLLTEERCVHSFFFFFQFREDNCLIVQINTAWILSVQKNDNGKGF